MSHFKDPQNGLHWLDDDHFEYILPSGSVLISDDEAEAIRAAAIPAPTPIELIQQLEADNPFTHRNLRDLTLGALKLAAMATGGQLEDNPAAMKVMALEQQISILRGEL